MWFVYVVEKVGTRVSIELFQGLFDSRVWGIFKSVDRVLEVFEGFSWSSEVQQGFLCGVSIRRLTLVPSDFRVYSPGVGVVDSLVYAFRDGIKGIWGSRLGRDPVGCSRGLQFEVVFSNLQGPEPQTTA